MTGREGRRGFIALYRSIVDWEWYDDPSTCRVFIHLLVTAHYEDAQWRGTTLKRGSREISLTGLATECSLTVRQIRTALRHLEMTGEVTRQKILQTTVISIKNYDFYQGVTRQATRKRHTANGNGDTASDTTSDTANDITTLLNKETNKPPISPKGELGVFQSYAREDAALLGALKDFDEMRRRMKKPMTDRAKNMLLKKLDELEKTSAGKVDRLGDAVLHCWLTVYPARETRTEEDDSDVL